MTTSMKMIIQIIHNIPKRNIDIAADTDMH